MGEDQSFSEPFGLVVDAARANGIDVAPVSFVLRMGQRIAVHLTRGRQHEPGSTSLGDVERHRCPIGAGPQGLDRQSQVVGRRSRRSQMKHRVEPGSV